jgi:hypothetical protein
VDYSIQFKAWGYFYYQQRDNTKLHELWTSGPA